MAELKNIGIRKWVNDFAGGIPTLNENSTLGELVGAKIGDIAVDTSNNKIYTCTNAVAGTWIEANKTIEAVIPPANNTDNIIPVWDGTDTKTLKDGYTVGTQANNLIQLDSNAKLPAVDGSQLTGLATGGKPQIVNIFDKPIDMKTVNPGGIYIPVGANIVFTSMQGQYWSDWNTELGINMLSSHIYQKTEIGYIEYISFPDTMNVICKLSDIDMYIYRASMSGWHSIFEINGVDNAVYTQINSIYQPTSNSIISGGFPRFHVATTINLTFKLSAGGTESYIKKIVNTSTEKLTINSYEYKVSTKIVNGISTSGTSSSNSIKLAELSSGSSVELLCIPDSTGENLVFYVTSLHGTLTLF